MNDATLLAFKCRAIAGAANNQLERSDHGAALAGAGILYAPDYVINAGGLINVADELRGYDRDRAMGKVEAIYRTLREVFSISREQDIPTNEAADHVSGAAEPAGPPFVKPIEATVGSVP